MEMKLYEIYNINPLEYKDVDLHNTGLEKYVINRLNIAQIYNVKDLLEKTEDQILAVRSMGAKKYENVKAYVESLPPSPNFSCEKYNRSVNLNIPYNLYINAEKMANADFSFAEDMELSPLENSRLAEYKNALNILGAELAGMCYREPKRVYPLIKAFAPVIYDYDIEQKRLQKIADLFENIPPERQSVSIELMLFTYGADESVKEKILFLYASPTAAIKDFNRMNVVRDEKAYSCFKNFLKWCSYDTSAEIEKCINNVLHFRNAESILRQRINGLTYDAVAKNLKNSAVNVKVVEKRIRDNFSNYRDFVIGILTQQTGCYADEIEKYKKIYEIFGDKSDIIIYLIKKTNPLKNPAD